MRKFSVLAAIFLVLCVVLILFMRSCGGDRLGGKPAATEPPASALTLPTVAPEATPNPTPTVAPTPSYAGAVWTTDSVNLRRSPDTNSEIIAVVPAGTQLERTALSGNGWSIVTYNEATCYVSTEYVTETPPVSVSPDPVTGATGANITTVSDTVWTTDTVNLRRGPGTSYEIGESLTEVGVELHRTGITDNNWSRVIYKNVGYYVIGDYITTTQPTADPDKVAPPATEPPVSTPVVGAAASEGEFRSDTGVQLNVIVRWSVAVNGDGTRTLTLNAYLASSRIDAAANPDDLCFKVGNDTFYVSSKGAKVESDSVTETLLGTCSATVSSVSVPVTVSWRFNGTYSGLKLENVEASDTLVFSA